MPQFDISSFGVQLYTLLFLFLGFYFIFSWKYLPSTAFLLKTRKKQVSSSYLQKLNFEDYAITKKAKPLKSNYLKKEIFFF